MTAIKMAKSISKFLLAVYRLLPYRRREIKAFEIKIGL